MNRFHLALWLSLGLHAVAIGGGNLFHDPKIEVSHGQTRTAVVFQSDIQTKKRATPSTTTLTVQSEPEDRASQERIQVASTPVLEEGVEEVPPSYSKNMPPQYPKEAFLRNIQGTVWILTEIDSQGNPSEILVERSSGSHLLDKAAADAVVGWKFIPALRAGIAVASRVRVPFHFEITMGKPLTGAYRQADSKRKDL